jgi:hypothetical protein
MLKRLIGAAVCVAALTAPAAAGAAPGPAPTSWQQCDKYTTYVGARWRSGPRTVDETRASA